MLVLTLSAVVAATALLIAHLVAAHYHDTDQEIRRTGERMIDSSDFLVRLKAAKEITTP